MDLFLTYSEFIHLWVILEGLLGSLTVTYKDLFIDPILLAYVQTLL